MWGAVRRSVRASQQKKGGPPLESTVATQAFWHAFRSSTPSPLQAASGGGGAATGGEKMAVITSEFGVEKTVTRVELAQLIIEAIPTADAQTARTSPAGCLSFAAVAPGVSGSLLLTPKRHWELKSLVGLVGCARCGRFIKSSNQGLEWHMKAVHGMAGCHSEAHEAVSPASTRALHPQLFPAYL